MKKLLLFILLIYSMAGISQTCQYLAYDGCNYLNGLPLEGASGGTGWESAWDVQNDNVQIPGYQGITGTMSWYTLQSIGNSISGGIVYSSAGRRFDLRNTGPFAAYLNDAGLIGRPGTTLFLSVLLQKNNNDDDPVFAMLQGGNNVPWVVNQNPRVAVGYFGAASNDASGNRYWGIQVNGQVYNSNVNITTGSPMFLGIGITFGTNSHTITSYINNSALGVPSPPAGPSYTVTGSLQFSALAIYLGSGPAAGELDEIRLASSIRCASPDVITPVSIPPDASFTTSVTDGTSPLAVQFDARASVDFDGVITGYEWNFMDGSPVVSNAISLMHTFTQLGEFNVALTVTDNDNQRHTTYRRITVRNAAGTFSCNTSLRLLNKATCGANDGRLQVNARFGANVSLLDQRNSNVTASDPYQHIYSNLAAGNYRVLVTHPTAGCRDTFNITIQTDSNTCAGWQPPSCLKMGINLDYLNYYGSERPFKNLFKYATDWLTYNVSSATPWAPWNTGVDNEIPKDANGYPTEVPFNTSIGPQGVRSSISANGSVVPGNYTLWYDGNGDVEVGGVTITNRSAGRIDFTVPDNYTSNIWINIARSERGNNVRNIRILRPGDENTYREQPFYQPFLDKLALFYAIRYGEWGNLNTGTFTPVRWEQRASPDYFTESSLRGVSYETMIDLCNATRKDIWVGVPHTASDEYIAEMARLFRDRLRPELNVYLEYSNEVWNWFFAQAYYVRDFSPQNISHARKYAQKARNTFRIWHSVWGSQSNRVKRLLNTQISNFPFGEEMMAELKPDEFDYLSPSWYFGYTGSSCERSFNSSTTPQEIIDCTRDFFRRGYQGMKQDYLNASLYNKQVINYEGGQHMTDGTTTPHINAVWDAQVHPDIYNLYNEVIDSLKKLGPVLTNAYNLARFRRTPYGSFGHLEHIDQTPDMQNAPKWMAVINNACAFVAPSNPAPADPVNPVNPGEPVDPNTPADPDRTFRIVPNPFRTSIRTDSVCTNCSYQIFDSKGRLMFNGRDLQNVDLSWLSKGLYVLFIYDERGSRVSSHKLIKL